VLRNILFMLHELSVWASELSSGKLGLLAGQEKAALPRRAKPSRRNGGFMKGATRFALAAVVCWLALAQAYIVWRPASYVPLWPDHYPQDDDTTWTCDNNTWSVTGNGDTINVLFVERNDDGTRSVFFHRSTDEGLSWDPHENFPTRMDPAGLAVDSACAPSLAKLDAAGETLVAVFLTWGHGSGNIYGRVEARASLDYGLTWGNCYGATDDPILGGAFNLSVAGYPHQNVNTGNIFEAMWREPSETGSLIHSRYARVFHTQNGAKVDWTGRDEAIQDNHPVEAPWKLGTLSLSENSTSERTVGGASQNRVTFDGEVGELCAIRVNFLGEVGEVGARHGRAASFQTSSAPLFRLTVWRALAIIGPCQG
jgi:hypothetical protein